MSDTFLATLAEMLGCDPTEESIAEAVSDLQDQVAQSNDAAYWAEERASQARRTYERQLYEAQSEREQAEYERDEAARKLTTVTKSRW